MSLAQAIQLGQSLLTYVYNLICTSTYCNKLFFGLYMIRAVPGSGFKVQRLQLIGGFQSGTLNPEPLNGCYSKGGPAHFANLCSIFKMTNILLNSKNTGRKHEQTQ